MMLLSRARRGASGNAATKMVVNPNWRTGGGDTLPRSRTKPHTVPKLAGAFYPFPGIRPPVRERSWAAGSSPGPTVGAGICFLHSAPHSPLSSSSSETTSSAANWKVGNEIRQRLTILTRRHRGSSSYSRNIKKGLQCQSPVTRVTGINSAIYNETYG